jgi:uncharacterized membrane protein YkgB
MKTLFSFAERLAGPLLRISLGLVLLWIGSLHLYNPQSIVVLLSMSLPFLAYSAFVYVLGALEVIAGVMLIAGLWVRYVGLLTLILFAGTLTIFVIAPGVTGFPVLNLTGQFLWKDIVLASAAITVVARDAARHEAKQAKLTQLASRSEEQMLSRVNSESEPMNDAVPGEQTHSRPS